MMSPTGFTIWLTGAESAALARPIATALEGRGRRVEFDSASGDDSDVAVFATDDSSQGGVVEALSRAPKPLIKVEAKSPASGASGGDLAALGETPAGESPLRPEFTIHTGAPTAEESVAHILSELETLGLLAAPAPTDGGYDDEDEEIIRQRLEAMGYL